MPSAAEYYPNIDDTGLKYSIGIRVKPTKREKPHMNIYII